MYSWRGMLAYLEHFLAMGGVKKQNIKILDSLFFHRTEHLQQSATKTFNKYLSTFSISWQAKKVNHFLMMNRD